MYVDETPFRVPLVRRGYSISSLPHLRLRNIINITAWHIFAWSCTITLLNEIKRRILMRHAIDQKYHFFSFFNSLSGGYMRTGIIDSEGKDTGVDPFMASFPHLIDVGIMGHCIHGRSGLCEKAGVACYQTDHMQRNLIWSWMIFNGLLNSAADVLTNCTGWRGDPDQHEHFAEILTICHENQIVPNLQHPDID